jgi:hypothetical protein
MVGWAIRNGAALSLDLAPHIWKRLIHGVHDHRQVKMTLADLAKVEKYHEQVLSQLLEDKSRLSTEEFNALYNDTTFEVDFGRGPLYLVPNGQDIPLTKDNVDEYVAKFIERFFELDSQQFEVFADGIQLVCSRAFLTMLTESMAVSRSCAKSVINVDTFKAQCIVRISQKKFKMFIDAMRLMTNEERKLLLKFISGTERIIPNHRY